MAASSGRTILVADDNPDQRALYVDILTHAGYVVVQAQDGAEAIQGAVIETGHGLVALVARTGEVGAESEHAVRVEAGIL